jgi:hypothetical protein
MCDLSFESIYCKEEEEEEEEEEEGEKNGYLHHNIPSQ